MPTVTWSPVAPEVKPRGCEGATEPHRGEVLCDNDGGCKGLCCSGNHYCEASREVAEEFWRTICENCSRRIVLTTVDNDGVLVGDECVCGQYVTRYMPGQEPR